MQASPWFWSIELLPPPPLLRIFHPTIDQFSRPDVQRPGHLTYLLLRRTQTSTLRRDFPCCSCVADFHPVACQSLAAVTCHLSARPKRLYRLSSASPRVKQQQQQQYHGTTTCPMPSLGFLKKKRTRDSNPDPSTSTPTSPVAATSPSKPFDSSTLQQRTSGSQAKTAPGTAPAPSQGSAATAAPASQQQQMNPANAQGGTFVTPLPMQTNQADSQSLPSINNLIHQPQNGASTNNYSSFNPAALGAQISHPPSASPGTDPGHMQQQQQQAYPQPAMQPQQQAGHLPDQQQQQYQQQQHEQRVHHQHQGSVTRVTKGKYSLGDFDILRTLGTGSFGRVHLVQSKHNQRFYAIKVLKKAQVVKMKQVEHTNDERRMLSDVKHPFLITLWGTFQDWKNLYMVMDFVEGGELFSLLRKSGVSTN